MSQTLTLPTSEALAALCSSLDSAHQSTLLEFAQFLKMQETRGVLDEVDEHDEAEWDRLFENPVKVAGFARWADESLARSRPLPMDEARL